jgi:hypothetical protein
MIWNKYKIHIIAGLVIILLLFLNKYYYTQYLRAEDRAERAENNIQVIHDTIRLTQAFDGSNEYDKLSFLVKDINELKALNQALAKEVAITKGKVLSIQNIGGTVQHAPQEIPTTKIETSGDKILIFDAVLDTTYSLGNVRELSIRNTLDFSRGDTTLYSFLQKDELKFTATTGIKQTEKGYEIFVRPDYPNLTITKLEGAVIGDNLIKKETKVPLVTFGGSVGWTPLTYDIHTQKSSVSFSRIGVTAGLNFNLAAMLRKRK